MSRLSIRIISRPPLPSPTVAAVRQVRPSAETWMRYLVAVSYTHLTLPTKA